MAAGFFSKGTSAPHNCSIDAAPDTNERISNPATAIGNNPTGVKTEKRPPTLSGITKVL